MSINEHPPQHVPVLLEAVIDLLDPKRGESYLDLTAGYAGHASAVLQKTGSYKTATLVDRDDYAIKQLLPYASKGVRLLHQDFAGAVRLLVEEGKQFDMVLVDLGVSSPQLDQGERGFSFTNDGPLDMRMDRRLAKTAADLVNTLSSRELTDIIVSYGEERPSDAKRITQTIIEGRPFSTTKQLADLIAANHRRMGQKIHPATRTFQALRIAVNSELDQIRETLPLLPRLLNKGGRVAIISFHSLEDRLIKRFFKEQADSGYEAELLPITKKPISGATEDVHNPRARSAKLRAAVKK